MKNPSRISRRAARKAALASFLALLLLPATIDAAPAESVSPRPTVQEARALMDAGRLDEAEGMLRQVIQQEPGRTEAFDALTLLRAKRYEQQTQKPGAKGPQSARPAPTPALSERPAVMVRRPVGPPALNEGRRSQKQKLAMIIFDEWGVPSETPLGEVIKDLNAEARKRDPERRGINLVLSSHLDVPTTALPPSSIDPATGQPVAPVAVSAAAIENFLVKVDPPLTGMRLADILDVLTKMAHPPADQAQNFSVNFHVDDYGIVLTRQLEESERLFTRTYKVDPSFFRQGLEGMSFRPNPFQGLTTQSGTQGGQTGGNQGSGPGGFFVFGGGVGGQNGQNTQGAGITGVTQTNQMSQIQQEVRNFFISAGLNFQNPGPNQPAGPGALPAPQKALFYNDRAGVLFVRASLRDLDLIEAAIGASQKR